jgi:hypothetical protein
MTINAQIPLPSFEDIRKTLQFWIDQQDKWFYFETGIIQSGKTGETEVPGLHTGSIPSLARRRESNQFVQTRIVGNINDIISYPPSLLLSNVSIFTVSIDYQWQRQYSRQESIEKRDKYGLVFSQISYYEPIDNIELFLKQDKRVNKDEE